MKDLLIGGSLTTLDRLTLFPSQSGWIGIDFDGTLRKGHNTSPKSIGDAIP